MKKILIIFLSASYLLISCKDKEDDDKMDGKKETSMNKEEDKEERNKQVIMNSMAAFDKGDMNAVFAEADPGMMDYADGSTPPMPLDSVKMFFTMFKDAVPDYKGSNYQYYADGDAVLVVAEWSGTQKKDLMGMKPSGKPFKFNDVDIFTFNENGKITSHRSIANLGKVLME